MRTNQVLLFSLLLVVDGMHYIFARALLPRIPPTASAMWVMCIGAAQVLLFAAFTGRMRWGVLRRHLGFFLAIGFLIAASTALSYESIAFVDPGTASLLGKTATVFSVLIGVVWLGERLNGVQALGAVAAMAGAAIIAFQPGDYLRFGALLVIVSSLAYAIHTALVKRDGEQIEFVNFFLFRLFASAAFLFPMAGLRGAWVLPDGMTWLLLILTASVDVVLSRTLYYATLRRLPMSVHSIVLTLSPAVSIVVALLLFGERPTLQQSIGGVVVLLGVLLVTLAGARTHAPASVRSAQNFSMAGPVSSPEEPELSPPA